MTTRIACLLPALLVVTTATLAAETHGAAAHWSYRGATDPAHWGELEADFSTCKLGHAQSPIDIRTGEVRHANLPPIETHYHASGAEVVNNGHTIQVNLAAGGSAVLGGTEYRLVQFHFHLPSEETVNGHHEAMVAHLVHRNAAGKLAVIAVPIHKGDAHAALAEIFAQLPAREGAAPLQTVFNAQDLLPATLGYYAFTGSLTTPPCSEDVAWHVLKTPITLSAGQVAAFHKLFPMDARPTQPLYGRVVEDGG